MASVHRDRFVPQDLVDLRPGEIAHQAGEVGAGGAVRGFEDEDASTLATQKSRTAHAGIPKRDGFDAERVESSGRIVDPCGAAPEQPQTSLPVEVPRISRPVPASRADGELGLIVAVAAEVSAEHVIPAHDDLSRLARR